jgi:hypothetical protein
MMKAIRMQVVIPEERTVVLQVPGDTAAGPAEVILLIEDEGPRPADDSLVRFLDDLARRPRGRSAESIQAQVQSERDAWG